MDYKINSIVDKKALQLKAKKEINTLINDYFKEQATIRKEKRIIAFTLFSAITLFVYVMNVI